MKTKTLTLSSVVAVLALAGTGLAYAQTNNSAPSSQMTANGQPPAPPTTAPDGTPIANNYQQQPYAPSAGQPPQQGQPQYYQGAVNSDGNVPIAQPTSAAPQVVYVQGQPQTQVVYQQAYSEPVYYGSPYYYNGGYYGPGYYYGPGIAVGVGFGGYYRGGYGYYRGGYGGGYYRGGGGYRGGYAGGHGGGHR